MFSIALQSFWFMFPAIVANITPVIFAKFRIFENMALPLSDIYLGANKTVRGLVFGIIAGILAILSQYYFDENTEMITLFSYREHGIIQTAFLGFLLSCGILLMDMLKSFFKRKYGIPAGSKWFPFDLIDSWGALFLGFIMIVPPVEHIFTIVVGGPVIHWLSNKIGHFFRLKKVSW